MAQRMAYGVYIFTIQNVSIKFLNIGHIMSSSLNLQYKMFLLNKIYKPLKSVIN